MRFRVWAVLFAIVCGGMQFASFPFTYVDKICYSQVESGASIEEEKTIEFRVSDANKNGTLLMVFALDNEGNETRYYMNKQGEYLLLCNLPYEEMVAKSWEALFDEDCLKEFQVCNLNDYTIYKVHVNENGIIIKNGEESIDYPILIGSINSVKTGGIAEEILNNSESENIESSVIESTIYEQITEEASTNVELTTEIQAEETIDERAIETEISSEVVQTITETEALSDYIAGNQIEDILKRCGNCIAENWILLCSVCGTAAVALCVFCVFISRRKKKDLKTPEKPDEKKPDDKAESNHTKEPENQEIVLTSSDEIQEMVETNEENDASEENKSIPLFYFIESADTYLKMYSLNNDRLYENRNNRPEQAKPCLLDYEQNSKAVFAIDDDSRLWINPVWANAYNSNQCILRGSTFISKSMEYIFEVYSQKTQEIISLEQESSYSIQKFIPATVRAVSAKQYELVEKGKIYVKIE